MTTYYIKVIIAGGGAEYLSKYTTLARAIEWARKLKAIKLYTLDGVVFE